MARARVVEKGLTARPVDYWTTDGVDIRAPTPALDGLAADTRASARDSASGGRCRPPPMEPFAFSRSGG
ncbi:MAG: hypothetical protein HY217_03880 [Candidatus Rokubacteria bacterium]|nr:hypothetical protein [Candidatus Rokubacteria bacterium]